MRAVGTMGSFNQTMFTQPSGASDGYRDDVELEITDEAAALLRKRGGTMAIDFIRPTG